MVAFILVGSRRDREKWSHMYNDEIMILYILIAIFYSLRAKPLKSAFWLTLAMSLKAGALLLLPALLGHIHYQHGLGTLLASVLLIVSFQIVISLPFTLTDTNYKDYLVRTKFTGAGRVTPSEPFWDFVASRYDHSIFWTFIPQECYESWPCLPQKLRIAMFGLNIYHFFFRKWCLPRCLGNLRSGLAGLMEPLGRLSQKTTNSPESQKNISEDKAVTSAN